MHINKVCGDLMESVLRNFKIEQNERQIRPYQNGLVNKTYLVTTNEKKYILQKINNAVFKRPDEVMNNIFKVTKTLEKQNKISLKLIKTTDNKNLLFKDGSYYRMYEFLENFSTFNLIKSIQQMTEYGRVVGEFHKVFSKKKLNLYETIPNFHNTSIRYDHFKAILYERKFPDRIKEASKEIAYLLKFSNDISIIQDAYDKGIIPRRIVHYDTKLNNIMFNKDTDKAICLIDLDTVMYGISLFDYADALRIGASTEKEDTKKYWLIDFDEKLFTSFTVGYLTNAFEILTPFELEHLVDAILIITLEVAVRFLGDYLLNDQYFHVDYDKHNFDRAVAQITLHKRILEKKERLEKIVKQIIIHLNK